MIPIPVVHLREATAYKLRDLENQFINMWKPRMNMPYVRQQLVKAGIQTRKVNMMEIKARKPRDRPRQARRFGHFDWSSVRLTAMAWGTLQGHKLMKCKRVVTMLAMRLLDGRRKNGKVAKTMELIGGEMETKGGVLDGIG